MPRSRARQARAGGFTLLEVLVALVILGVALSAALRGAMALTSAADDTRLKLLATLSAENRLLELRLARSRLELGRSEFDCTEGGIAFRCEQEIKATPNPFFRRVEVRVLRDGPAGPHRHAEMLTVLPVNQ